jgi:hypothetical protein
MSLSAIRAQAELVAGLGDARATPTFNAHAWAVPPAAYDDVPALSEELQVLSYSTDT